MPDVRQRACIPRPLGIADLPEGFSEEIVATGLTGAVAMAAAPDGQIFVCEQTGARASSRTASCWKSHL
jgi:hypothetical protein